MTVEDGSKVGKDPFSHMLACVGSRVRLLYFTLNY